MVKSMAVEKRQREKYGEIDEDVLLKSVEKCTGFYEKQIAALDEQIYKVINKHPDLEARFAEKNNSILLLISTRSLRRSRRRQGFMVCGCLPA
jgi:hypothetical protein